MKIFNHHPFLNLKVAFVSLTLMLMYVNVHGQIDNPDWGDSATPCVPNALLYPGVGVVSCGVVEAVPVNGRYVVAYMALNNAIPTSAPFRADITNPDSALHHSDWLVSNIGNVFGVTINQSTAEVFVTASSNYGAGFGYINTSPSVLNYGVVGSPANATEAAGTVYRIDPVTGSTSVFVRLPQQTTTVAHWDCEDDAIEITRNNTGVGLGNIAYDELNNQYFVTNTEDGRIYRISSTGTILDSYDPLIYDDGAAGISDLEDVPYGIAVEPGSNRLFFGFVDDPGAGPAGAQALPGAPSIYSIDLNTSGGFVGTVDTTTMPSGATYLNYVGTDQLHGTIPTSVVGGGFSYTDHTTYFISDLAFSPDGKLLVSVRSGCYGSWHSSYNHWAETDLITLNTSNNLYDTTPIEYDISVDGDAANEDAYGGVAVYELNDGSCDIHFVSSSSDVLSENGPHGIAIWHADTINSPLSPLGVFEYGVLPNDDPKGVGGDIEMYNGCSNTCNISGANTACENDTVVLTYTPDCPSSSFTWEITSGNASISGVNDSTVVNIVAGSTDFTASVMLYGTAIPCTHDVTVSTLLNPSITGAGPFCIDDSPVNLSASPPGGTYSGTGITNGVTGTFDPAVAGAGTHTITYTLPGICMESATTDILVNTLPVVNVSGGPFCISDLPTNLTASPGGGTFSGTGITEAMAGTFDPATAGAGTHTITYDYTDANGCSNSAMTDVVVNALPVVSLSGGPFCIDDAPSNLNGNPAGGTYSGPGITDMSAGTFDPAIAGVGTHTIYFDFADANGCRNSTSADVVVHDIPVVTLSGGPFCIDDAASNLAASPTGGIFSGPGITDMSAGTFDPAIAGVGTHTITYDYTDANGCSSSTTADIVVNNIPTLTLSGGPFCIDDAASNLTASPGGGTFSGTGITNAMAGTFDPAIAGAGTHTITYDYTDGNGCSNSTTIDVDVNQVPILSLSGGPFCFNDAPGNLSASPTGGVFSGSGITDSSAGTFDPAIAGVGTHTITYDYTDGNGCSSSTTTDVVVNDIPPVFLLGDMFCIDAAASNLTAGPSGGTFSGTGITDAMIGTFDPATAGVGTHTITYSITDGNGCSNNATADVIVHALPVLNLSGGPYCLNEPPSNLTASPGGGTFSGTGITDPASGTFDPAIAGIGTHTITYDYTDANGCNNSTMTDIVVNSFPDLDITGGQFCFNDAPENLSVSPTGGVFSGSGITDTSSGTFDPATAGVGTHTITYDYTDSNGCSNTTTTDIDVFALPVVYVSGGPFCIDDAASNLTASPVGGTFSGTGITDAMGGTFDPATAGVGTHTITYDYTDGNGCSNSATTDVIVNALPMLSLSGGPFCVDASPSNLPASPSGGVYSGTGITDTSLGTFNPATAGVGTHTITYDYTDGNGCSNSTTTDVVVNALPVVSVSGGTFCVDDVPANLTGSPGGGTYSGTGITDAMAGTFDPATAGVGTHTITYDYTDGNGCSNSATTDVIVNALPVLSLSGGPFCVDASPSNLPASPSGGVYSGTGITDTSLGTFNPATAGVGTHTITYDYTDGNGCSNSATTDVIVNALPVLSLSGGPFCVDASPSNLSASPMGGIFSGTGITDTSAGTFNPATAGIGTHTITYDYTDGNGCSNSATTDVIVNALPVLSLSGGPFCVDDTPSNLMASPTGGVYSGTGITDASAGTFDPATAGVGTHTITYDYTDSNGCSNSISTDVVVNDLPNPTIDPVGMGQVCIGNGIITLTASPTGGVFSGSGITDGSAGTFDPKVAGLGVHTITYDYTDANGCSSSTTLDIEVINCFDLALTKVVDPLGPQGPFVLEDQITFLITVYNQGQTDAIDVVVEDYIPSYMTFISSSDFTLNGASYLANIPLLSAGSSHELRITLELSSYDNLDVINNAEIISADDDGDIFNPLPIDQDSDLASIIGFSDANSEVATDNDIDDENVSQPGTLDNPLDQDDYDPSVLPILDLANTKTVNAASLAAAGGTFEPNEVITFEINVFNQGNVTADNIVVTDTIPCGFAYDNISNDAEGWILSGTEGSAKYIVNSLLPGADTTIHIHFTIKPSVLVVTDCDLNPAVVPGKPFTNFSFIKSADVGGVTQARDVDSDFDSFTLEEANTNPNNSGDNDTNSTGNNQNGSQDDNDPALVEIFDLALSKIVSPLELPYKVGEVATFEICVSNQGNVPTDSINLVDFIPAGLEYNIANNGQGWIGSPGMSQVTYSFDDTNIPGGTLDFGEQVCVDIQLTILSNQTDFVNRSEITSATSLLDDGMGGVLRSLVTNDNDSSFDNIPADEAGGAEETGSDALTSNTNDPAILGDGSGSAGDEIASTDDDSSDPAFLPIVDFALRKKVADSNVGPFAVGDTIRFLIEVLNQGNVGGSNITLSDYIPNYLAFVSTAVNTDWTGVAIGGSSATAMATLPGPITPGEIDSIYIDLEILAGGLNTEDYTNSAEIFAVYAAPGSPSGISDGMDITDFDVDSTPDADSENDNGSDASSPNTPSSPNPADDYVDGNGLDLMGMPDDGVQATDEDDMDPVFVAFHDVALTKTKPVSQGPVDIGDVVTFTVTVYNEGNSPLDSVSIIDYIPAGFSFTPNNNWVASGSNAILTATIGNTLLPGGGISIGGFQDFPIELTVAPTATLDNLVNIAEITGSRDLNNLTQDDDADSNADTTFDNDAGGADDTDSDDEINGDGTGVPGDDVAATDEDDHDPEGVELALYSIGNQVWLDSNNSGTIDGAELGIENVVVELYNASGLLVESTMTDNIGLYLFDTLVSGEYTVVIPALNFGALSPLENLFSSTGGGQSDLINGPYEDNITALDPDTNTNDNDDNGVLNGNILYPGAVVSNPITLGGPIDEPINENPDNDPLTLDENENLTVDFGFVPLVSLGSNVFIDYNNDGNDDGDGGIQGVIVEVYNAGPDMVIGGGDDLFVDLDVTDINGDWFIDSLLAGNYYAIIPTPDSDYPNSSSITDTADNGSDGNDNGSQAVSGGVVTSPVINLSPNSEVSAEPNSGGIQDIADDDNGDMTIDFGFPPLMSLGSTVFYDHNDDGVQDFNDPLEGGIEGVQVDIYYDADNNGTIDGAETTPINSINTDSEGNYFFDQLLPGNYQVGIPIPDASAQASSTGQNTTDNNDLSDDGDQFVPGGPIFSSIINLEGLQEPTENGANPGADQDDSNESNGNMTVDFGFIPQMSIGSTVFYDPNDNGIQDTSNPLEDGVEGIVVNLYYDKDGSGTLTGAELTSVATTVTDAEGNYLFTNLPEGDFIVGIMPTDGAPVSSTGQMVADGIDGNDNGDQAEGSGTEILSNLVNLDGNMETHIEYEQGGNQDDGDENNGDMTIDFGVIPNMSLGSTVFLDNNDDGLQDPFDATEIGIPSITVQLLYDENNDGLFTGAELLPVETIWTDLNGDYFFGNLPEGNYQVVLPDVPNTAPTSSTPSDVLDNGEDGDDNGLQPGGSGTVVSSPTINLTANVEPLDIDEQGQGGMQDNTTASPDGNGDMTVDFGFIPYVSVGSNVFVDENNDGIDQGIDEEGIVGITIDVYATGPDMMIGGGDDVLEGTTITDVNGDWLVDSLTPGEYYVVIDNVHADYPTSSTTDFSVDDAVDDNDNGVQPGGSGTQVVSNVFTLTGDAETSSEPGSGGAQDNSNDDNGDMTIDFGFVPLYSLGNQVWLDDNYDGLINGIESGIDGVDVELYDTSNNFLASTVTSGGGYYLFDSLLPGDYIIIIPASEVAPNGPLQDYLSSTGTFNNGGIYENPGVDADTNIDNDDNGTYDTNPNYPSAVVSTAVTLGGDDELLNKNSDNYAEIMNPYENLTVDFGFIEKVYDVALIKETSMETGNKFGDDILFTITVSNQGNIPLTNIEVTDYIAPGFTTVPTLNDFITDAGGSGWTDNGPNSSTYVIGDTIAPNDSREIRIYLTLTASLLDDAYINFAEISMFQDTIGNSTDGTGPYTGGIDDKDSNPDDMNDNDAGGEPESDADDFEDGDGTGTVGGGDALSDEDDHDPAKISVVDIALAKTVITSAPYIYGQEVEFNIEVMNQGNVDLEDVLITDYIPCGFIFSSGNSGWSYSGSEATYTISTLAGGETINISIYFIVAPVSGACDHNEAYVNYAEVSQMFADYDGDGNFDDDVSLDDADSLADNDDTNDAGGQPNSSADDYVEGDGTGPANDGTDTTDEDDHDPAFINIFDLAQIKYIDNEGPYNIGETATFEFEVTNQGNVDAYNIVVTDYLADGFSFSTFGNAGWSVNGSNLVYTIAGPLAPGETFTMSLDLTIVLPMGASTSSWYNESEIREADDNTDPFDQEPTDADSTPDNNPDNDNDLVDGPDDDSILDPDDDNDNVIDENPSDPFGLGDDDEDDNDAAGVLVVGGIGDSVWKDLNGNGIQDPGEPGVEGVLVTLTDCDGNFVDSQTSDADGFYFFNNLIPGDYQLHYDISSLPAGCDFTQQNQGSDDSVDSDVDENGFAPCTTIQGGEYDSTFDAGLFILVDIGDFVWHDLDGDGIQDGNEPGIPDVMVLLYNEGNELIQVTMTDEDGKYLFTDVYPDTYYIVFTDPEGFVPTFPNATDDANDSDITNFVFTTEGNTTDLFTIVHGQEDDLTFDAGYYICIHVGDKVWYDVDEDDIADPNENGINGLEVNLYRLFGSEYVLFDTQITDHKPGTASDDGYYKFCAPPGTYYIEIIMPPIGLVKAKANVFNNLPLTHPNESILDSDLTDNFGLSTTASFIINSGDELCNIGAGFYPMANVGNRVWMDSNENGIQDSGEQSVSNVKVEAFEAESGLKVGESTTNNQGTYMIDYLEKKDYYLKFSPPSGFGFTTPNSGDEEIDSDVDHSYGFRTTAAYSLEPGETYINIDAGLKLGALPLEWVSISAEHKGTFNLVAWETVAEVNTEFFIVERSLDGVTEFEALGEVLAIGESAAVNNYEFEDKDVRLGIHYYRIKQVDKDGKFEYSDVVSLKVETGLNTISLAPNPAFGKSVLSLGLNSEKAATVDIIGSDGRLIRTYNLESSNGESINARIEIDQLPSGVYSIYINQGAFSEVKKLIVVE